MMFWKLEGLVLNNWYLFEQEDEVEEEELGEEGEGVIIMKHQKDVMAVFQTQGEMAMAFRMFKVV